MDYSTILPFSLSNNPEPNPDQPSNLPPERWAHLHEYERKYFQELVRAYDEIMLVDDVATIARRYQASADDVRRAKDYAFGSGVSKYKFIPDIDMAAAWKRMAVGQGTEIDEVLLRHEIFESDLVVNQGMNQKDAHELALKRYPWSVLLKNRRVSNE